METVQTDESGKLCVPEDICRKLGLKPGTKFHISLQGSGILLKRIESDQTFIEGGEEELQTLMKLSEISLDTFLNEEPDIYSDADLKVK